MEPCGAPGTEPARHYDSAIRLQCDGTGGVGRATKTADGRAEVGDHLAAVAEAGVQRAVRVVADQGKVGQATGGRGLASHQNLAVVLQREAGRKVGAV